MVCSRGFRECVDSCPTVQSALADTSLKVPIAANWKDVCLQNTSKWNSYHLKIWQLL